MSVVTVLGAPGRTGRQVVRLLTRRGFTVRAGVRDLHRRGAVAHLGEPATIVDLAMSQDELAEKFTGSDVVINCADAADPHPDAVNLVEGTARSRRSGRPSGPGVRRYLQLSAMFADAPDQGDPSVRSILNAKQIADNVLHRSSLVWTAIRPGTLTDDPGTGRITATLHLSAGRIPREHVATVILGGLIEAGTENRGFDISAGDLPVATALAALR